MLNCKTVLGLDGEEKMTKKKLMFYFFFICYLFAFAVSNLG